MQVKGLGDINEKEFHDFIGEDMCLVSSTIDEAENVQMLLSPIWRSSYLEVRRISEKRREAVDTGRFR